MKSLLAFEWLAQIDKFLDEEYCLFVMGSYPEALRKMAVIAQERAVAEKEAEVAACIEFIECELEWESFRAEGFLGEKMASRSSQNCQKLAAFLKARGNHGARLLAAHEDQIAQKDAEIARLKESLVQLGKYMTRVEDVL